MGQTAAVIVESLNEPMRPIRADAEEMIVNGELHTSMRQVLDAGLTVVDGGVFFTWELERTGRGPSSDTDLTGQEAFVNKLHLDELADTVQEGWAAYCVAQGVMLAERLFDAAAAVTSLPIDVVISADLGGSRDVGGEAIETYPSSTFRFFVHRDDEPWLTGDLNGFAEPVALLQRR